MTEHKSIAEALAAFQGEAPKLHKGETATIRSEKGNFSYRYLDLVDVVEKIQPLMLKHGLSWSAFPCIGPDGKPALRYALRHTSGDVESDVMPLMLAKGDAQAHGSAITYARRYALCTVLNLVADADDDGQGASQQQQGPPFGPPFDASIKAVVGAACTQIAGGEPSLGRALFESVANDCGGYMPQAAALALIHAAEGGNRAPHADVPEVT